MDGVKIGETGDGSDIGVFEEFGYVQRLLALSRLFLKLDIKTLDNPLAQVALQGLLSRCV